MKQKTYKILLAAFVVLIVALFASLYQYNEVKKEVVAGLESEGYVCEQNVFGIYKTCSKPKDLTKWDNIQLIPNLEVS